MKQVHQRLIVATHGQGLYEVTREIAAWVAAQHIDNGLLSVFCRHTSASLTIQENADSDVQRDLEDFFRKLVPENPALYRHTIEGPDDMPAHIKSALTNVQLSIPVTGGQMALGTWQGIFLFEHRAQPHDRELALHLIGE
ncbi:MAG: secondary thiamine-phosphate synthase enzyme YjbQ [Alphaproteobacteria bacterium]|nr:secondary thiamine-phosphate synthase enzyme YjbQ [Alphaproteobacteria bacterium]